MTARAPRARRAAGVEHGTGFDGTGRDTAAGTDRPAGPSSGRSGGPLRGAGFPVAGGLPVAGLPVVFLLVGPLPAVVGALVALAVAFVADAVRTARQHRARAARESTRAVVRAAAVADAERVTSAWLAAVARSGREPSAADREVSLWEWTCAACRTTCVPVRTEDEADHLGREHDTGRHRGQRNAHVHRIARLSFTPDEHTAEVTTWPDAA